MTSHQFHRCSLTDVKENPRINGL